MPSLTEKIEGLERSEISIALEKAGWVKARAARMLGISERMIGYKIRKYGIKKEMTEEVSVFEKGSILQIESPKEEK